MSSISSSDGSIGSGNSIVTVDIAKNIPSSDANSPTLKVRTEVTPPTNSPPSTLDHIDPQLKAEATTRIRRRISRSDRVIHCERFMAILGGYALSVLYLFPSNSLLPYFAMGGTPFQWAIIGIAAASLYLLFLGLRCRYRHQEGVPQSFTYELVQDLIHLIWPVGLFFEAKTLYNYFKNQPEDIVFDHVNEERHNPNVHQQEESSYIPTPPQPIPQPIPPLSGQRTPTLHPPEL